ncbi:hypothetical protein F2P45_23815 [Massilia sp. CCM 8733]|uniref:Uncharacterized protein n=1 Tax=Massilia mucilaginosa TaxID=2609282 RepID=A0ABX0NYZ9_9BURK|nr:hypothetical protein [Massilia mucilaginosa]NHZ92009.1 hypothetical protein [Massilia mucilaginosa]
MFWNLDIGKGVVVYDQISHLPDAFDVAVHVGCLREDMLQIRFGDHLLLDVGWYPSFNEQGRFLLLLVKDQAWDEPLEKARFKHVVSLKQRIVRIARKLACPL